VRRRAATIVIGLLILAMLAGSVGPFASRRPRPEPTGSPDAPAGEGGSPFAGTPAAQFADGTAGLVIPAASAVGDLRTADVALALVSVRHATAAANLESSVLRAGSIAPYRHVVGPATQARLDGHEGNLGDFVTRFPGQGVELATTAPKVSGTFTYRVDGTAAVLVEGRHLFAYATAAPGAAGNIEIVAVRRDTVWRVERTVDGMAKPELLTSAVASSGHCLAEGADGFVWPRFTTPDLAVRAGSAVPVQWDVAEPLVASVDCFLPVGSPV
jgi:hypothetical protein